MENPMAAVFRLAALSLASLATGCATPGSSDPATRTVILESRSGSNVTGTLQLRDSAAGLHIQGEVRGLQPNSEHGFHIHETGDCSAADAASAGGHFNPGGAPHGHAGSDPHHAGDMPNIHAGADGVAKVNQVVVGVTLAAGANSVAARALIVHRDPDDYRSQPAGNAGPRIACGVIPAR
ncbi:MAG: superoxide dismutase family protein [Sinobacteraceae bacterium]|nr:superoxide dismutase family protein [Nevskiaceae bacterium]MCP5340018.1 superoxide dismutase family protein [Nevskiaceae bacterium]MCP5359240.1 superoxide dismutase family protein [Nevskiaceae bacterium]MCP5466474.1 superoxide dismutase family protein [Nevskiaceae bacterium]MCP5471825.1 superoxide dismutase family protein [Nevskiaceae bacterium]